MMKPEREKKIRRILIALDPLVPCLPALDASMELAKALRAELIGLIVEDENLLRLAGLPEAHQIRYLFADRDALNLTRMHRALRVQADHLRNLMDAAAERSRVTYSFRSVCGQVAEMVLAVSQETDLIVLGRAGLRRSRKVPLGRTALKVAQSATETVLLVHNGSLLQRPLVVFYDASPSSRKALALASELTVSGWRPILIAAGSDDPQGIRKLQQQARDYLQANGQEGVHRACMTPTADFLAGLLRTEGPCILLIGDSALPIQRGGLRELLDRIDDPVFVVR